MRAELMPIESGPASASPADPLLQAIHSELAAYGPLIDHVDEAPADAEQGDGVVRPALCVGTGLAALTAAFVMFRFFPGL
ncbi:MAG: hypothetical protein JWQ36_2156 [Enterovirga sp.]|jgi:hypothetical protein|nr:hypothetical protein [Enterovirga sp.]